jgi:hypothetical protein
VQACCVVVMCTGLSKRWFSKIASYVVVVVPGPGLAWVGCTLGGLFLSLGILSPGYPVLAIVAGIASCWWSVPCISSVLYSLLWRQINDIFYVHKQ